MMYNILNTHNNPHIVCIEKKYTRIIIIVDNIVINHMIIVLLKPA